METRKRMEYESFYMCIFSDIPFDLFRIENCNFNRCTRSHISAYTRSKYIAGFINLQCTLILFMNFVKIDKQIFLEIGHNDNSCFRFNLYIMHDAISDEHTCNFALSPKGKIIYERGTTNCDDKFFNNISIADLYLV